MMLAAKTEMRPLWSRPVIFTNQKLMPFLLALAGTGFSYWYGLLQENHSRGECRVQAVKLWDAVIAKEAIPLRTFSSC